MFGLKSEIWNLESHGQPQGCIYNKEGDLDLHRAYNTLVTGAQVLFEIAAAGSDAAREALNTLANQANRQAGHCRRAQEAGKKAGKR